MDAIRRKLSILADAAKYDASCASSGSKGRRAARGGMGSTTGQGICHSYTPDGRCVSLLKILLTNHCIYDCRFCVNRLSSDVPRARFSPSEVVELTLEFYRRNYIEGLFLSSGIVKSPDYTMEQLIEVARSLREDHDFAGYIHVKTIPGASGELVDLAGRHADRVSCNIELPTQGDLASLAPEKRLQDVHEVMGRQHEREREAKQERSRTRQAPRFAPAGQSTQMVVGASPTPDRAILASAHGLYRRFRLRRVYYSAYSPTQASDTPIVSGRADLLREHRLYQADWLLRFYGFTLGDLTAPAEPNLPREIDPKLAAALRQRERFPVDLNRAPRELLLRVPGLGVRSVDRVLEMRRQGRIRLDDLATLRVSLPRVRPFAYGAEPRPEALRLADSERLGRLLPGRRATQLDLFGQQSASGRSG